LGVRDAHFFRQIVHRHAHALQFGRTGMQMNFNKLASADGKGRLLDGFQRAQDAG